MSNAVATTDRIEVLWTANVKPLDAPVFIDNSLLLRAHLLTASPAQFRQRNIFIDSSIGVSN